MDEYKHKVEAILFTTGRFMDLQEISQTCELGSVGMVKEVMEALKADYAQRSSALTLLEEQGKWKLGIKKEFNYLTTKLLADTELDRPTQETLALIAYRQPVLQSEIIKIRGTTAYDHIKFLREEGFLISERQGRSRLLKLAPKFFDYFDLVEQELKAKFSTAEAPDILAELPHPEPPHDAPAPDAHEG